ncbi:MULTISPECIES: hypothetical protein [Streptomyces]|uniref:Uncharacterized protein n=1 Tax=Streptomyces evansiae TaxID=3075535 RepID=A0ABU2QZQ4_9ACTN|nr:MULTISPECIES: hypothetical protein [unclassified Streptomyces]MDT0409931.1 hypothetical protein [Streptomyces sp. DSM 41979]MYQ59982.1 hypothetical protein [Streptomyces sp. SID4926]SCE40561.1 hypothetical protein GA0115252_146443 [Streptomyces sp. DfronAA-171]
MQGTDAPLGPSGYQPRRREAAIRALLLVAAELLAGNTERDFAEPDREALLHDLTGSRGPLYSALADRTPALTEPITAGEYRLRLLALASLGRDTGTLAACRADYEAARPAREAYAEQTRGAK